MTMNKIVLMALFLVLSFPLKTFAQQESMRSMAVEQLYQYGQAIYDRGDYDQAEVIFSRILRMDPTYRQARDIATKLNKKGAHIIIPPMPQVENKQIAKVAELKVETIKMAHPLSVKKNVSPSKAPQELVPTTYSMNTDLQEQIHEADQAIESLRVQVVDLRNQISQGQKDLPIINN